MKRYLTLLPLLTCFALPVRALTVNLDAGKLTSPVTAPMQIDNTSLSTNGSLLLLLDLGSSNSIDNTLSAGSFVSGTNLILAAGGFNANGGADETLTAFHMTNGTPGDYMALRWFPQLTYAQFQGGSLTGNGDYFGTYAPSPLGSAPDGGDAWIIPSSGSTIALDFFTRDSDMGGSQLSSAGFTAFQIETVPEPSTYVLLVMGMLASSWFGRIKNVQRQNLAKA